MIDAAYLRELASLSEDPDIFDAYQRGYDRAMDMNWKALEHVQRIAGAYRWLLLAWFTLGAVTGYLIGSLFG